MGSRGITRRDFLDGTRIAIAGAAAARLASLGSALGGCSEQAPEATSGAYPPALRGLRGSHDGSFEVAHALVAGRPFPLDGTDTGEQSIDSPSAWSSVAKRLLDDVGVDVEVFRRAFDEEIYESLGLSEGIFFDAENRWPHGYSYDPNTLWDPEWRDESEWPWVIGRRRHGRIAIANADAGARAYTDTAIDQAHRAVAELLAA